MRIQVRVTGQLIDFCSVDAVELPEGASVDDAVGALGIPPDQVGLVSVDGEAVSKAKRGATALAEGSELVVMAPLTGG
ncbi:MAG TPA: molybdopterin synthase sulfur carrier subunit [Gammaproteobacteria bacterium]|jgi:sulfur carrier protein ThiS|nr:molybdopterin synthase sulfur carrier subunit [Acidiferrobacteraceae bacterium]MDP6398322.1 MoaD/ThiS family protein [Arenicellales bacterium]HCX88900.1 molybdopterin synthase sulfur carrier subunit [Gammaproteobacteria bacterium]MDP6552740.1 MoaD/ThiS family protein [Arenicellales bacterium]MDP6791928.1 MoaD/ThiS family protein [Arenicellales bacterium]|tara:strand:- start:893 stop:1126 length:234 start_codon:yes stop_codon:yes gene_type:complete